jgi:hypothetical protein
MATWNSTIYYRKLRQKAQDEQASSTLQTTTQRNPTMVNNNQHPRQLIGSIVVVAKCPLPGQAKTRLIPLLGQEGAVKLATAMLCDVLTTLSQAVC